jgi:hypothetical protein
VLAVLALAGCGGSGGGSDLAAVCKTQRAALGSAPQPVGLRGAAEVLQRVVTMDTELRAAVEDEALTVRIDRLDQNARRGLAAIQDTDPDRSMFPLRTGAASGRRVLSAARGVLNDACG